MRGARSVAVVLLLSAGCVPEEGPSMEAGQDCLGCHDGGEARAWTVAGTMGRGATVDLADAAGRTLTLHGNAVGNFYTAESLAFPLRSVRVDGRAMPANAAAGAFGYGGCNRTGCHAGGGGGGD